MGPKRRLERLIHADWSVSDNKKWMAIADRTPQGWLVSAPRRVPSAPELIDSELFCGRPLIAGFDFPIGIPAEFGRQTRFNGFLDALSSFGRGDWAKFFDVANNPAEISLRRPFYPKTSQKGRRQIDLLNA